uniref:hypothetical protein n=1 Tax=Spiroplasma endosymbiont of Lariophagus distinguendus TaxID=2935082 RepID=UPI00207987D0
MDKQSQEKKYDLGAIVTMFRHEFYDENNQKIELNNLNMWNSETWNNYENGKLVHEENGIKYKLCHKKGKHCELTTQEKQNKLKKLTPIDGFGRPVMIWNYDSTLKKYSIIPSTTN